MYCCNITGQNFDLNDNEKERELACRFGYNSRFRAICYVFTESLYGANKIMCNLEKNTDIKGFGMSDNVLVNILNEKFNYTSAQLDIYNEDDVKNHSELDFIISSEVFNHITPYPSLQSAFDNLYKMLKNGGHLIFSVPYTNRQHEEHFPNLYNYEIVKENNEYVLHNTTIDGNKEVFNNLIFHDGPGNNLEMRVFSRNTLMSFLDQSGFYDIRFHEITEDMNKHGIFWSKYNDTNSSLIISAKKHVEQDN